MPIAYRKKPPQNPLLLAINKEIGNFFNERFQTSQPQNHHPKAHLNVRLTTSLRSES